MIKTGRRNCIKLGLTTLAVVLSGSLVQAATIYDIEIEGMAFSPATITVKAGDTIRWANMDGAPHTATDAEESFDTDTLSKGKNAEVVMNKAGEFDYFCQIHPGMKGKIIVEN